MDCRHDWKARNGFWYALWKRLGIPDWEVVSLRLTIKRLMSDGALGDGIGPGNTAHHLYSVLGFQLSEIEVWAIWRSMLEDESQTTT